jgi:hypothetical protein
MVNLTLGTKNAENIGRNELVGGYSPCPPTNAASSMRTNKP